MSWVLVNDADGTLVGAPQDVEPTPGEAQRVEEVALGYPSAMFWDPAVIGARGKGAFVDKPDTSPLISVGRFKLLFTQAERIALRQAAAQSAEVADFLDILEGFTDGVSLADPAMVAALGQLEVGGLLTAERAAAILAGQVPS